MKPKIYITTPFLCFCRNSDCVQHRLRQGSLGESRGQRGPAGTAASPASRGRLACQHSPFAQGRVVHRTVKTLSLDFGHRFQLRLTYRNRVKAPMASGQRPGRAGAARAVCAAVHRLRSGARSAPKSNGGGGCPRRGLPGAFRE